MTIRDALGMVESGDRDKARGRAGEISRFQIKPVLWRNFAAPEFDYHNPNHAWLVTEKILNERKALFLRLTKRYPNNFEMYALWNAPGLLIMNNCDWTKLPEKIKERCQRFHNLMTST